MAPKVVNIMTPTRSRSSTCGLREVKSVPPPPLRPKSVLSVCHLSWSHAASRRRRSVKISQRRPVHGRVCVSPSSLPSKTVKRRLTSFPPPPPSSSRLSRVSLHAQDIVTKHILIRLYRAPTRPQEGEEHQALR
ncbi:hypothetical protein EIP86_001383 [Pleurotus ostreatoroseus]|nr:hypothetical protein EIP86_001383 [Pleurotus ostreatoroseus]